MGRKRKYYSEEERKEAQRKWQMEHYQRNKDKILKKARDTYKKKKREKLRQRRIKFENKEDKMLVTYMEQTCEKRKHLQSYFQKKNWVEIAPKCDYETYMTNINNHKFICCPRGNGIDTYRFWESIFMGCVPIVESSPLDDLYSKVNCIIVDSFLNLKKEQLDNFIYNNNLMGEESLLLESYDSNISTVSSSNSY